MQSDDLHPIPEGADYRAQLIAQGIEGCLGIASPRRSERAGAGFRAGTGPGREARGAAGLGGERVATELARRGRLGSPASSRCSPPGLPCLDLAGTMPEPVRRGRALHAGPRRPARDRGARRHLLPPRFGWAEGGLLGVGVFFTLSGYLITDILLNQVNQGGIKLKSFWLARARRLLPALFLMLIVVMAWVTVIGPHQPADFRTAALSRRRLLQQLVADLPRRLLLRPLRAALAAQPPLVALGRGAVLHRLALPADARRSASSRR